MQVLFCRTKMGLSGGHCSQAPSAPSITQGVVMLHCVVLQFLVILNLLWLYSSMVMFPRIQLGASRFVIFTTFTVSAFGLVLEHYLLLSLQVSPFGQPMQVSFCRQKIGLYLGHCSQIFLPLRTKGVERGHWVTLCVEVIANLFSLNWSVVRLPSTQFSESKLVMQVKLYEAGESQLLVSVLQTCPLGQEMQVSLSREKKELSGHRAHAVVPLRTKGVATGQREVLYLLAMRNLLAQYCSKVRLPSTQLLASRLLTFTDCATLAISSWALEADWW